MATTVGNTGGNNALDLITSQTTTVCTREKFIWQKEKKKQLKKCQVFSSSPGLVLSGASSGNLRVTQKQGKISNNPWNLPDQPTACLPACTANSQNAAGLLPLILWLARQADSHQLAPLLSPPVIAGVAAGAVALTTEALSTVLNSLHRGFPGTPLSRVLNWALLHLGLPQHTDTQTHIHKHTHTHTHAHTHTHT